MTWLVGSVFLGGIILVACSSDPSAGLCSKLKDCSRQQNTTFDDASCRNELKGYRDTATSKGCAPQFDDAINCISGLSCTATDDQVNASCSAKIDALSAACNKSSGGGDGGGGGDVLPPSTGGNGGGGMDQCTAKSKCPNDPVPTQAQTDMCKMNSMMQSTKCPNEAKAFGMCFYNNWTCDADGKTDPLATIAKCQAEQDALAKCVG
jgi:hypothetical protein